MMRRLPPGTDRPSRSSRKRAAEAVTELAHQLAELPDSSFKRLPLSEELRDEFQQVRKMKESGARERQLRHLSSLLRDDGELIASLQEFLSGYSQSQRAEARTLHQLEELRLRLLNPEQCAAALAELALSAPNLDRSALQHAIAAVRTGNDRKAFRTIFRLLQAALHPDNS